MTGRARWFLTLFVMFFPAVPRAEQWFGPPVVTVTPYSPTLVRAADLTNDGLADAVIRTTSGYVVFHAQGVGSLLEVQRVPTPNLHDFLLLDVDQDSWTDLLGRGGPFTLWANDTSGRFAPTGVSYTGFPRISTGDLDQDGYADVIVSAGDTQGVLVYYGIEGGLSETWSLVDFSDEYYFTAEAGVIGDINGDGLNDVVAAGYRWSEPPDNLLEAVIRWRLRVGAREFSSVFDEYNPHVSNSQYLALAMADLGQDGDTDIAATITAPDISHVEILTAEQNVLTKTAEHAPGGVPHFAHLDADTEWDLLIGGQFGQSGSAVYRGREGHFDLVQELPGSIDAQCAQVVGGDWPDLVCIRIQEGDLEVWPNLLDPTGVDSPNDHGDSRVMVWPRVVGDRLSYRVIGRVRGALVSVFDVAGRRLVTLGEAGAATQFWDVRDAQGRRVPAGAYWIKVERQGEAERIVVAR